MRIPWRAPILRLCLHACFYALVAALAISIQPAVAATKIERVVSPGGIEAWLVRDATVPLVAMEFAFKGGTNFAPAIDAHFHEGTVQIKDKDTLEQHFTVFANGKANPEGRSVLHRVASN